MNTPNVKTIRMWYRIHKWTSLVCTAFILMSCITGLPLIFVDEINQWTDVHQRPASMSAAGPFAPIDPMISTAQAKFPYEQVLSVGWDDDEPRVFVNIAPDFKPTTRESHTFAFDAHTGRMLEEAKFTRGLMHVAAVLHITLFLSLPGELLVGLMGILLMVSFVSGVLVYGPFMRRINFGTVRRGKSTRLKWFDLHNLLGIVVLTWGLVVGGTGALNTLSGPLFAAWRAQIIPALLAPYKGKPMPSHYGSVDAALEHARAFLPKAEITTIVFPNDFFGSPRHYLIWTRGRSPITSRVFTPILIDAESGAVVGARPLPWYLRALEMSRPLHFGDYGGMPLKIIWALFDVALIVILLSGVYLWLSRRKTPLEVELNRRANLKKQFSGEKRIAQMTG